jgi:hypothetical protein
MERFFENKRWVCLAGNETNYFISLLWADENHIVTSPFFPLNEGSPITVTRDNPKRKIIPSGT